MRYKGSARVGLLLGVCATVLLLSGWDGGEARRNDTTAGDRFVVQPYYVYPGDQPYHPEYERAARSLIREVRQWYLARVGKTFRAAPLRVVRAPDAYLAMRCGPDPDPACRSDRQALPRWLESIERAVGGFRSRRIAWVFAQGGGGWAGANLYGDFTGFSLFGDWVLEPISGVVEPAAIPCAYATWQCKGGVPRGTTAHELGHAFGLHHPDNYAGKSIMRWHGDYPNAPLMRHERIILRESPYFGAAPADRDTPWLDFENADVARGGETLTLTGRGFQPGDVIEFRDADRALRVAPDDLSPTRLRLRVPDGLGPGYLRPWRGARHGNVVPINLYPPVPSGPGPGSHPGSSDRSAPSATAGSRRAGG